MDYTEEQKALIRSLLATQILGRAQVKPLHKLPGAGNKGYSLRHMESAPEPFARNLAEAMAAIRLMKQDPH